MVKIELRLWIDGEEYDLNKEAKGILQFVRDAEEHHRKKLAKRRKKPSGA